MYCRDVTRAEKETGYSLTSFKNIYYQVEAQPKVVCVTPEYCVCLCIRELHEQKCPARARPELEHFVLVLDPCSRDIAIYCSCSTRARGLDAGARVVLEV